MTDFRALCAELVDDLELCDWPYKLKETIRADIDRARAALADEPAVPEGREPASVTGQFMPTDAELLCIAAEEIDGYGNGINPGDYEPSTEMAVEAYGSELCAYARAVLARWGNPAPQPVPVSEPLPGPRDCDAEGRCWYWRPSHPESGYLEGWMLRPSSWGVGHYDFDDSVIHTHWLPAHALPLPGQEVEG